MWKALNFFSKKQPSKISNQFFLVLQIYRWNYHKFTTHLAKPHSAVQIFSISSALEIIELFFFYRRIFLNKIFLPSFRIINYESLKNYIHVPKFFSVSSHFIPPIYSSLSSYICCGDDRRILNYMLTTQK